MSHLNLWQYHVDLTQPLAVHSHQHQVILKQREGLLLEWHDGKHCFWSEISPLPLFSKETLQQSKAEVLEFFSNHLIESFSVLEQLHQSHSANLSPSTNFGIEAGLYQLFHSDLKQHSDFIPRINGLMLSNSSSSQNSFHNDVVKQKISGQDFLLDCALIKESVNNLKENQKLRIDCNRSWTLQQAIDALSPLPQDKIEFVEEPLIDLQEDSCLELYEATGIHIALDESLREDEQSSNLLLTLTHEPNRIRDIGISALVIKPMLTGLYKTISLIDYCVLHGFIGVISSSIESSISLNLYWKLAQRYQLSAHQGLGTNHFFPADIIQPLIFSNIEKPILQENELTYLGQLL